MIWKVVYFNCDPEDLTKYEKVLLLISLLDLGSIVFHALIWRVWQKFKIFTRELWRIDFKFQVNLFSGIALSLPLILSPLFFEVYCSILSYDGDWIKRFWYIHIFWLVSLCVCVCFIYHSCSNVLKCIFLCHRKQRWNLFRFAAMATIWFRRWFPQRKWR